MEYIGGGMFEVLAIISDMYIFKLCGVSVCNTTSLRARCDKNVPGRW